MKKLLILMTAAILGTLFACHRSGDDSMRRAARILYEKQCELIAAYTDSLENLPDTADREPVLNRFRDKMTALNLKYPHAADAEMTEGENDTLFSATRKLLKAAVPPEPKDTITEPTGPDRGPNVMRTTN